MRKVVLFALLAALSGCATAPKQVLVPQIVQRKISIPDVLRDRCKITYIPFTDQASVAKQLNRDAAAIKQCDARKSATFDLIDQFNAESDQK